MKIATYDCAKNKTAPRGMFICPYCGKVIERRLSKVKNKNLVFCDNECRAKWTERETLRKKLSVSNEALITEVNKYDSLIRKLYREVCFNKSEEAFDMFYQTARISIWKAFNSANNEKGSKLSYYAKAIKHDFFNYLRNEYPKPNDVEVFSLDDYEETYDRTVGSEFVERPMMFEKIISALKEKKARSFKMLIESELDGLSHSEIAKRFKCSVRDVTVNIYNAKKLMKKEYAYEI